MRLITHSLFKLSLATAATVAVLTIPSKAMAITFSGVYDISKWTLTNSNTDGSVDTTNAPSSIDLIGGNNNSGTQGTTDWTIPITTARAGTVNFSWSYGTTDTDGNDIAGYLYNGNFTQLASVDAQSSSAPVSFSLNDGDTFGFRVKTLTNNGGPGVLTVSSFDVQAVPFESSPAALLTALPSLGLMGFYLQRQRRKMVALNK
jgi:hypothetical protein